MTKHPCNDQHRLQRGVSHGSECNGTDRLDKLPHILFPRLTLCKARKKQVNHPSLPGHPCHSLYTRYFPNGGGSIFTFEIKGGQAEAWRFIDSLEIFSLLANVADVKSLVIHPATTTHSQLSPEELAEQHITPATVRLSVGTEHIEDLLADLSQALEKV